MTLPSSGPLSFSAIATELGRAPGAAVSLGETAVRTLAGLATGAVNAATLYGKTAGGGGATFTPDSGAYSVDGVGSASFTINCSASAVWSWSRSGSTGTTSSVASGGSATSITVALINTSSSDKVSAFNISATSGGVTKSWSVTLVAYGSGFA